MTPRILSIAACVSATCACATAVGQRTVWRLYNDKSETWYILVKPAQDADHRGKWYTIPSDRSADIELRFQGSFFLEGRPAGNGSYHRLTEAVDLRRTRFRKVGDIFTPKKGRNGRILRNRRGAIIYESMEANGFQESEYYADIVRQLRSSQWKTTYTTSNNNNVQAKIILDGGRGSIEGNGKLSNVLYTPSDSDGEIIVAGDWSHGTKRGRFVFRFSEDLERFEGKYRFHDSNTWRSWRGTH